MPELICPVCAQPLHEQERVYRCAGGHSFDRAKSGYVNLLIQRQSGAQHGDDKEMVRARRAFLDGGFYAPLQEKVCAAAVRWAPAREEVDVLDSGCGECYYTAAVEQALRTRGKTPSIVGVDISKDALRWGEKRGARLQLAVASAFRLPVAADSCDLLLDVFAPFAGEEYCRVLRRGGVVLHVSPGADHLWELKQAVYETPYRNDAAPPAWPGLVQREEETLCYPISLETQSAVADLFRMTPYAHKTGSAELQRLAELQSLQVTAEFVLRTYQKV